MRNILSRIFALLTLVSASISLSAQGWSSYPGTEGIKNESGTYYTFVHISEESGGTIWSKEYNLNGPSAQISFSAKRQVTSVGNMKVAQFVNGKWENIFDENPGKKTGAFKIDYVDYGPFSLNKNATKIKFYTEAGATLSKYFKNVKVAMAQNIVEAPANSSLSFESAKVGTPDAQQSTTIDWCNTPALTATITGEDAPLFSASITNNAAEGKWGTATVTVTYKHSKAGTHNATLSINSHTISLSGTTEKKDQSLTWNDDWSADKPSMPIGKEVTDAATATSALPVIYTSSNEEVIAITQDGHAFKAIAAGEAVITATQVGNAEWAGATPISKTFIATAKKIQFIAWSQNLSRLKTTDAPVTLTAKVLIVNAETGERLENESRTLLLTYTSGNEDIVKADGNTLTIIGEGETTITATVAGDDNYEAASAVMPVRVRVPSAGCEDRLVLSYNDEIEFFQSNTSEIQGEAIAIDRNQGVPDKLTFQHKGEYWILPVFGTKYYKGSIKLQESTDGGNNWRDLYSVTPTVGTYNESEPVQLSRNATHIRFVRPSGGEGYHYVKDIEVTPAQYLETSTPAITIEQSIIGDKISKELIINYSNVKDEVQVTNISSAVQLQETSLGNECGDFGTATLHLTITPTLVGTTCDTVTLTDAVSGMTLRIPVTIQTQRNHQSILWSDCPSTIEANADITINATAQTPVHIISSDSTIAYVENGKLQIITCGTVTLTAIAEESEIYESATLSQDITITPLTPEVTSLPIASAIRIGQSFNESVLTGGTANVEGYFTWDDSDDNYIHVSTEGEYTAYVMFVPANINWYTILHNIAVSVTVQDGPSTDLRNTVNAASSSAPQKVLLNGAIYIIRDGRMYDMQGRLLRQ